MMLRAILLLATVTLGVVSALPEDTVMPEMTLVQEFDEADATIQAYDDASMVLVELRAAGKDDNACRDLANTAAKEVTDTVAAAQKTLDQLDDGSGCDKEGQGAVTAAKAAAADAEKAAAKAQSDSSKADNADVDFGEVPLSDLKPGECSDSQLLGSAAYTTAVANAKAANEASMKAQGALAAANKAVEAANAAAILAKNKCHCAAIDAANKAFAAASEDAAANKKTWVKAKHMGCVLDGIAPADCKVPPTPAVTARQIAQGVTAGCEAHKKSAKPANAVIRHEGSNMCLNDHNNAQSDGATVNLWTCNGHASQKWVTSGDNIKHKASNMCLNDHNNAQSDGATVNLWTCNGHASQKWDQ